MENSWGKARVQHLTCAHRFLDTIRTPRAALSGNSLPQDQEAAELGGRPRDPRGAPPLRGGGWRTRGDEDQGEKQHG